MYTIEYTITDRMVIEAEDQDEAEFFAKQDLEDQLAPYEIISVKELN